MRFHLNCRRCRRYVMGSVGGGVWKTENSGRTWYPISDQGIPIGSIGAIAVAPSNSNIVYVGTGESDIRTQHSYGIGMYKSHGRGQDVEAYRSRSDAPHRASCCSWLAVRQRPSKQRGPCCWPLVATSFFWVQLEAARG